MYHAERYHLDFASPMAIAGENKDIHVFVHDFFHFHYNEYNDATGKAKKFFKKVQSMQIVCALVNKHFRATYSSSSGFTKLLK